MAAAACRRCRAARCLPPPCLPPPATRCCRRQPVTAAASHRCHWNRRRCHPDCPPLSSTELDAFFTDHLDPPPSPASEPAVATSPLPHVASPPSGGSTHPPHGPPSSSSSSPLAASLNATEEAMPSPSSKLYCRSSSPSRRNTSSSSSDGCHSIAASLSSPPSSMGATSKPPPPLFHRPPSIVGQESSPIVVGHQRPHHCHRLTPLTPSSLFSTTAAACPPHSPSTFIFFLTNRPPCLFVRPSSSPGRLPGRSSSLHHRRPFSSLPNSSSPSHNLSFATGPLILFHLPGTVPPS